ncbi:hypothetical protein GQ55_2G095100 [Panicum hallii var. hallii]|uniref:F-box domain-containing protein n=1 Tax=Panicum hallii var. hallii TaxID=1504633 RepID=A0A2T7EN81_9POAL|nr:hypothetical protein GQ55_2G095100 [Panicum hallii var. hallii]
MAPQAKKRRRTRKKAPAAAVEPADGNGLIGVLPNEVMSSIISLLPSDDGVRTRAVSSRWRDLWLSAPLNLDDDDLRPWRNGDGLVDLITEILSTHPGPARRLSLTNLARVSSTHGDDRYPSFDGWFQSPVLDKIKELHFRYLFRYLNSDVDPLPPSALRFTDLSVASYGRCHFPENLAGVSFPNLRQLTLFDLTNSEATLEAMIQACPAIRSLLLSGNMGFRHVRISSPTLVSLGVSTLRNEAVMEELTIVDAPSMERLLLFETDGGPMNIDVQGAPNLQVLGSLSSSMPRVQLGSTVLQKMIATTVITPMHTVKILALNAGSFELNTFVDILKCFPCLQKLYFTSFVITDFGKTMLNYGALSIPCLDTHLKEIVLRNFRGGKDDIKFAKFFVLNARVLRLMEFRVPIRESTKKWEANQRRKLPKKINRASQALRFDFVYDDCIFRSFEDTYCTHELSKADPFDSMF